MTDITYYVTLCLTAISCFKRMQDPPSVASLLLKWVSLLDPQSETFCIPQSTFTLEASTSVCVCVSVCLCVCVLVFLYDCLHPDPEGKKNNPSGRLCFPPVQV